MNAETYHYRKSQFAKLSDPSPYAYGVKLCGKWETGWTNKMDLTPGEYDRVKDVLLDDWTDSFRLIIRTSNAAFDGTHSELVRILRELADKVEQGFTQFPSIMDSNGNACGEASFH